MAALVEGHVDPDEVSVEHLELEVDGVVVPATHARPDGAPVGGVVVHPDIMGVRPLFDDLCRRLATHGLAAIAVEPFAVIDAAERERLDPADRGGTPHGRAEPVQRGPWGIAPPRSRRTVSRPRAVARDVHGRDGGS